MISDNFWKILFILMVLIGLVFWFKNHTEKTKFKNTASELADLIAFDEENQPDTDEEARTRYVKAVALVNEADESGIDTTLLLEAAFDYNGISADGAEAALVRSSLFDSQANGRKLGIFNEEAYWELRDGQLVEITTGPYKGENIAVALQVPASIGKGASRFLGNMVLVPESVANLAQDLELTENVLNTSIKLANADIITSEAAAAIKDAYYLQRQKTKY